MRLILKISLVVSILSIIYLVSYKYYFGLQTNFSVLNSVVVVLFLQYLLISLGLLFTYLDSEIRKYLFAVFLTIFILFLCVTFLLAWLGKLIIDTPLTLQIGFVYLQNLKATCDSLGLSYTGIVILLGSLPIIVFFFSLKVSSQVIGEQEVFTQKIRMFVASKLGFLNFPKLLVLYFTFTFFGLLFIYSNRVKLLNFLNFNREPITLVLLKPSIFGQKVYAKNDPICEQDRRTYPIVKGINRKNVIIIVVDALRADMFYDDELTPFLTSLYNKKGIHKVKTAFSTSASSFPGILTILRAKPWHHSFNNSLSIQEILKKQGFKINFILSGDHTNFYDLKHYYGKSVDYYCDGLSSKKYSINDDSLIFEGLEKIRGFNGQPNFFYFHMMSAHMTGVKSKTFFKESSNADSEEGPSLIDVYKNRVLQVDGYLRGIFDVLKHKGFLQNSLVVVTADHGESLGEKGIVGHSKNVYHDEINIPLVIFDSDQSSKYYTEKPSTQMDIGATILDNLRLPLPRSMEGYSLLTTKNRTYSYHNFKDFYAVIDFKNMLKYCYNETTKTEELFDLKHDKNEEFNLISKVSKKEIAPLKMRMNEFVKEVLKD